MSTKRIYKYPLILMGRQTIELPHGARVLHVGVQRGVLNLWVEIDTSAVHADKRTFYVYGTGHDIAHDVGLYIGTVLTEDQQYVWHVFEERN